jgi:hypothetical protein
MISAVLRTKYIVHCCKDFTCVGTMVWYTIRLLLAVSAGSASVFHVAKQASSRRISLDRFLAKWIPFEDLR